MNIKKAFSDYFDLTNGCIQWVPRDGEDDYVYIQSDDSGCHSNVGNEKKEIRFLSYFASGNFPSLTYIFPILSY